MTALLNIQNLQVQAQGQCILRGVDLMIRPGEVHVLMGPNGSGKSTLVQCLAGHPGYEVVGGEVLWQGESLLSQAPEQRALSGLFLAFQYPMELPGVNNAYFLKAALNSHRAHAGQPPVDAYEFLQLCEAAMQALGMESSFLERFVNAGFSGGEKKRNEILQLALLQPKLAMLDEIDSGLDVDALRLVAHGINALRSPERAMLLVTHYQRLLDYVEPDVVHILQQGRVVRSGDRHMVQEIEAEGYVDIATRATTTTTADNASGARV